MDSGKIARLVIALIFPIVFNVLFFLLVDLDKMNATRWVSYAFLHVAYLSLFLPYLLNANLGNSKEIGWSLTGLATTYFIIEFVIALVFLFIFSSDSAYIPALIIQVVLFAIFLAIILAGFLVNSNTRKHLDEQAENRARREQEQQQQARLAANRPLPEQPRNQEDYNQRFQPHN